MMRPGTWALRSEEDPRWNAGGEAIVGGFGVPEEAKKKVSELTLLYGPPPADLEWSYCKD